MARMFSQARQSIIDIAHSKGFSVQLKRDGTDLYVKNLMFRSSDCPAVLPDRLFKFSLLM